MNWELLLVGLILLAILVELRRVHRRLYCVESSLRARNEAIAAVLRAPRHLRAIDSTAGSASGTSFGVKH